MSTDQPTPEASTNSAARPDTNSTPPHPAGATFDVSTVVEVATAKAQADKIEQAGESASAPAADEAQKPAPTRVLVVDIGGTRVKMLATGHTEPRRAASGKAFTPTRLAQKVRDLAHDWEFDAVSIGYPGLVGSHGPRSEPGNLGSGWVGFDFAAAFGKPVKMVNDAVMQALGSYEGGRMLFLGLGTGLGSALITGHVIVPLELGQLRYDRKKTLGDVLGRAGLRRLGKRAWRREVNDAMAMLMHGFLVDYLVVGGGNAKNVRDFPPGTRLGHNLTAFRGGQRLWNVEDVWVLASPGGEEPTAQAQSIRML